MDNLQDTAQLGHQVDIRTEKRAAGVLCVVWVAQKTMFQKDLSFATVPLREAINRCSACSQPSIECYADCFAYHALRIYGLLLLLLLSHLHSPSHTSQHGIPTCACTTNISTHAVPPCALPNRSQPGIPPP